MCGCVANGSLVCPLGSGSPKYWVPSPIFRFAYCSVGPYRLSSTGVGEGELGEGSAELGCVRLFSAPVYAGDCCDAGCASWRGDATSASALLNDSCLITLVTFTKSAIDHVVERAAVFGGSFASPQSMSFSFASLVGEVVGVDGDVGCEAVRASAASAIDGSGFAGELSTLACGLCSRRRSAPTSWNCRPGW